MTLEPGSLLNSRYRIIEILGQGGMAAVYRAVDENLGLEVCVKENLFTTDEYARQFRLEATILAGLRQANLPRVSDHFVIEPQGQYLVMDFIEGEDLRQRVDRLGPLPEQEVIIVGVAICDALAYMHASKPMILHRDIKPGNVRITPNGHIYLVDFGLVKLVEGRETTNTGARAMTPGYSPPEQYGSARTDPRSDIFSLGATLYSALTNVLPEDSLDQAMNRTELTPVMKHNPRVSENVARIIEKCLAVRADDRYQSAEELRYALMEARSVSKRKLPLELVLQPPPMTLHDQLPSKKGEFALSERRDAPLKRGGSVKDTRPFSDVYEDIELLPPKRNSRKSSSILLLLILLPLIALSGIGIYSAKPEMVRQFFGVVFSNINPTPTLAFIPSTPTHTPFQVIATNTATQFVLPNPTVTSTLPPTSTSTEETIPTMTSTPEPTPMGGANQIAFASNRSGVMEIWIMNLDGNTLDQVTEIPEGACQPKWSPDGMRIVFISPCSRQFTSYPGASLFIINADGSNMIPLPNAPGGDYDPSWSPDGTQIAFTSLRNGGIPGIFIIDIKDYSIKSLVENESRAISQPAWSPNGKLIAYVNSDNRIWVMDTTGGKRHSLIIGSEDFVVNGPAWSPDGSAVIYTRTNYSDATGSSILMAVPYKETGAVPVEVPNSRLVIDVSYSFDGYWILFTTWFSGNHEISIMRPNGVDRHSIWTDLAYDFDPVWRPYPLNQP